MNDEKKETNLVAPGDPNAHALAVEADDSGWDDDDSGATVATEGPSFEMPTPIASPIAAPAPLVPPPMVAAPRKALQATLVGMMPDDMRAHLPKPPSTRLMAAVGAAPASVRDAPFVPVPPPPMVLSAEDLAELPGQADDGYPTMSGAPSPPSNRPLRDDAMPSLGFVPPAPSTIDNDVETMAIGADDPWLQVPENVEDTRPVSRDEMMMRHQDAQVVVGEDAIGDEATLAIGPGLRLQHMQAAAPPYGVAPLRPASSDHLRAATQHMPQGMYGGPGMQAPQAPQAPPWQGFDPMMPQAPPGGPGGPFSSSGQSPAMLGPSVGGPIGWGPPPNAPTSFGPSVPHQGMMEGAPPSVTRQPSPWPLAPPATPAGGFRFTPQLMLLLGAGVICVAIFVTGIVLFVTTKF